MCNRLNHNKEDMMIGAHPDFQPDDTVTLDMSDKLWLLAAPLT